MHAYAEWVWRFIQTLHPGEKPVISGSGLGGDMTLDL
jgi:hypothetical protein